MDSKTLVDSMKEWLHLKKKASVEGFSEPPIPAELFNADQLERHGITLALSQTLSNKRVPDILLHRLAEYEATLSNSCEILGSKSDDSFSPAREWLLDNFYLIQEQIYAIRRHLPKGYGDALPQLAGGLAGYPRVYELALEMIQHSDGRWDLTSLTRFIVAYQSVTPLTLGELWAVPIMLGIALIEVLSDASLRIVSDRNDRVLADTWVDRMINVAISEPKNLVIAIADMARSNPPMSSSFVAELVRRLQGAALALPLDWIEQHVMEEGLTIEQLVQEEHKFQAANQTTVSNAIASLRRLSEVDWRDFVESVSIVEHTLRADPIDVYSKMNFGTRDSYRHVVERLARITRHTEMDVAARAIQMAQEKAASFSPEERTHPDAARYCHVGYYLVNNGIVALEKSLGIRRMPWQKICCFARRWALLNYLGWVSLITIALTYGLLWKAAHDGVGYHWLWLLGILFFVYGSQVGIALVNLIATLLIKPAFLPRMDFSKGIPDEFRTLVVVPTLITSEAGIENTIEALEIRYLGNRDKNLHFMLLTDFNDAPAEHLPDDIHLLKYAEKLMVDLNARHAEKGNDIFFLCHRPRMWNESESIWMGHERKRGKLADLNNLLRGNSQFAFSFIVGRVELLSDIKYVITLDSDTQLPRESAQQYVAVMVHPLNRPRLDARLNVVIEGYGILQPRVGEALPLAGMTRYVQLCGSDFGIDPYTRTVSDVYQDIFYEGSFMGKGIYDVDVYQQVLANRFPENRILSHDLLEGCYLHSGFLSDVPLYENYPSSYLADTKRRIRWTRGDWQLTDWLFPRVLNALGQRVKNPLSALSRFKIFDNLRRSITPITLLMLFCLSLTVLPIHFFWFGTLFVLVALPAFVKTFLELIRKPDDMLASQHIENILHATRRGIGQLLLFFACLPHEAFYSVCAILQTEWRKIISKKHLLEWTSSEQTSQKLRGTIGEWLVNMWMGPFMAVSGVIVLIIDAKYRLLFYATPLLLLWLISPFLTRWLSRTVRHSQPKLKKNQLRFLHRMSRRTWGYFEAFMSVENNWLPPDNYQEEPVEALARRTSPTNIGLALLSNLTAYDFGYINMGDLLDRTNKTIQTLLKLERYRGHLYNWYSTETLEPLNPRYISAVDSGNLAGDFLTLRQGLFALRDDALLSTRYLDGLKDTFGVLSTMTAKPLPESYKCFRQRLRDAYSSFSTASNALDCCKTLCESASEIFKIAPDKAIKWAKKLQLECNKLYDEIKIFSSLPQFDAKTTLHGLRDTSLNYLYETRMSLIDALTKDINSLSQMDMSFLFDQSSHLLSIGYNVDSQQRDPGSYDLLSSEARLGSFVAIAQGQALQESWFALGRLLVSNGTEPLLISWTGSMFEYLMPLLIMPTYSGTLLDQTCQVAVRRQIAYGKQRNVPWGISESAFNAVDTSYNYLYRAFGVPGLGLRRGLEEDLVIAPYATVLALMIAPEAACANLQRLAAEYAVGKYGFYEAIDYTVSRLPRDAHRVIIRSFMAHHQGMSLLAFSYFLHQQPMQKRFVADPLFQATLLLLQERIPKPTSSYLQIPKAPEENQNYIRSEDSMRVFTTPNTRTPQVQLLSNGNYHLMITQAGGGLSRWKNIAVTRWREDATCDNWGLFSYIRDVKNEIFWSVNYQPTQRIAEKFKVVFSEGHAEFSSTDHDLDLHTEIVVSPEDDIELRRLRIHNRSKIRRTIEFTSYAEIVLAPQAADIAQPAFGNLFVETELLTEQHAILATRRPQDEEQATPWLCHLLNVYCQNTASWSFETDRARFLGRSKSSASPLAMLEAGDLSNTAGAVLDPIVAIRCRVTLEANELGVFDLLTGMADTRTQCITLVEKYQDRHLANRIFGLSWTHGQVLLHHLNITEENAQLYCRLAGSILYANASRRAKSDILSANRKGQAGLWAYSISGDLPIVLLQIKDADNIELVRQIIQAQAYWRHKGLQVDLVILNAEHMSYRQSLQDQIMSLVTSNTDHAGNIIVRALEQIPAEDLVLMQSVARVILSDQQGTLKEQLRRRRIIPSPMPLLEISKPTQHVPNSELPALPDDLLFFNGLGGFTAAGDEYLIRLNESISTPAPWVNILANKNFGTLVSESGQGYTWIENAHEFRLTPWENDPIRDSAAEAFYLRDEETGQFWSPSALPARGTGSYQARHGFGYSVFEHVENGIYSELCIYVAKDAAIKFMVLKVRNDGAQQRRLSATGYVAWVLGDTRTKNAMHIITESTENSAILAQNHYNAEWGERTAFFDAVMAHVESGARTITADRTEFLGRNGNYHHPAALTRKCLSGRVGAGLDPCGAIQIVFNLAEGQSREIVFMLGTGQNRQDAESLLNKYCDGAAAQAELTSVREHWKEILNVIQVSTPDPAMNLLANGWLLYQVLSSRLWGRSGYYQSGGAFGFRDQLQDVLALANVAPDLLRAHLLLCAEHQFEEGDVQHWWHPPHNRGVRTRCSDDYLWLPFAVCHYVETTGDIKVLDEVVPFLKGRMLNANEESYYDLPIISSEKATLYQHCVRAIKNGLRFGVHGLPLMGSGDWNDGMNLVGKDGRGESVWLAFFLYNVLQRFSKLALQYGDKGFASRCNEESQHLQKNIVDNAWDGEWYRRAYFDDGTPLGSVNNTECRIDSIAQSWSVLSGASDEARAKTAMTSLHHYLVNPDDMLIKLLDPPFDRCRPNPGYIKGYVPGIRENGGQYTHGAIWAAMAFAKLDDKKSAWELFDILNPINHGRTADEINRYKIEPYVIAGDVYSVAPHTGRGGWSWYTGSAGWLYRLVTEVLLGLHVEEGKKLRIQPILPEEWEGYSMNYRYKNSVYKITVNRMGEKNIILLDGVEVIGESVTLMADEDAHEIG